MLTLDPDVARKLKDRMARENASMRQVVNEVLRRGLGLQRRKPAKPFHVMPHSFGLRAGIDIHKFNQLVDDLEVKAFASQAVRAKRRPKR